MGELIAMMVDWVDMGLEPLLLILAVALFRRRALLTDTLWWVQAQHRQEWIREFVLAARRADTDDPVAMLEKSLAVSGHHLTEADRAFASVLAQGRTPAGTSLRAAPRAGHWF